MKQIRPLNIDDALRLASTLKDYIDVKTLDPDQEALDFVDNIVQKISAQDFLHCVKIMTQKTEDDLMKMDGYAVLALFAEGLRENKIIALMGFYHSLGL